ncbi:MAG: hypothetical protein LKM32_14360 [Chiayiivirga sp.]|uniref:hypothetical protein n=1 Tax=Chiayiivirga sp. TaxID=2041042 RepID=UPI0025C38A63|nr:hypothetical protein [Chiayiivirga sp.]MCI1730512.1 hypothetical protein [Chiayiivirga sp.]
MERIPSVVASRYEIEGKAQATFHCSVGARCGKKRVLARLASVVDWWQYLTVSGQQGSST